MKFGIATLSVIPIRKQPAHVSEQVSQLLFGETYKVIQEQNGWLLVQCYYDNYEGWIGEGQHRELTEKDFSAITGNQPGLALELVHNATSSENAVPIVIGSNLPFFDGMNFRLVKEKFIYN